MKILFVHGYPFGEASSFVQHDLFLLSELGQVEEISTRGTRVSSLLGSRAARQAIARNDLVFGWFGTAAAPFVALAALQRKPSIVVAGGSDVVDIRSIGYGLNSIPLKYRWLVLLGYALATRVLAFSDSSRESILRLPLVNARHVETLYLSVDTDNFRPGTTKQRRALTIGYLAEGNLARKGFTTFINAARITPTIPYRLGGKPVDERTVKKIAEAAPDNFAYLGYLTDAQLLSEYQAAKAYAQLSVHEGFGMALAEAMACECVPVTTSVGSLPEVVGDTGYSVPVDDAEAAAAAIQEAVNGPASQGRRARERVMALFSVAKRRQGLQDVIQAVL